jgi:omega-6 fatty acid desaturase (delta-12 desaturase)
MRDGQTFDSLPRIIKQIPRHCFRSTAWKSWLFVVRDLLLIAVISTAIHRLPLAAALLASVLLGIVMTGIFVIAHDAGHRSFSSKLWVNDLVGEIFSALLLWPFHVWRLSHDTHHRYTHHISKEIAWRPFSQEKVAAMPPLARTIYRWTRSWGYFTGSIFFAFYFIKDGLRGIHSRHFKPEELKLIYQSVFITSVVAAVMLYGAYTADGWRGVLLYVVIPQLTFQFWMSTFTFFHHTSPDSRFMEDSTWDPAKAQLGSTIHLIYPRWIEWLTHDISWHVPHHVCVAIPHYHLREAHKALKTSYPDIVREETFNLAYILRVIRSCEIAGERGLGHVPWSRYQHGHKTTRQDVKTSLAESV